MTSLEKVVRAFARRTTQNGVVVLITNGHPALVDAFSELGWPDPYPDPLLLPAKAVVDPPVGPSIKATVTSPERAVVTPPKGRTDGGL